jgi:spermidine/putrescine ABC transporter ATP-binding subunit
MDGSALPAIESANTFQGASVVLAGIEKRFDNIGAVRGISLDIRSGEFLTLLGPSGSGKTTTLMMIAGFEAPTRGDIAIDGRSVIALPPHKRNIGMVFQNYALFPHLTVAENIGFPLKQRGVDRTTRARLVGESLELVHLPGYEARHPRQLSGGQQQRVALARAIVFRPRLLLMDEPLGALDKQLRENLQLELRRLHADLGITFIYVTHDQEEALTMSDRVAVMNDGLIAQVGTPEDLYDRPCDRFVASFIGESNFLPGILRGVEDGEAIVDCGGTIVRAVAGQLPSPDAAVTLTVRPERMRFADAAAAAGTVRQNRTWATVTETVFAGERCRYLCRCDVGGSIVLKEPSSAAIRRRIVGERVEVAWSIADTVIV